MRLIYMGREFYSRSMTFLSSLVHEETHARSDWGKVEIALEHGEEVHIRPANDAELGSYTRELNALLSSKKEA